ncbi:MAG: hypothetical protein K0S74_1675 [Chlamydiales bacterium]|nr:hypothetical protein [Chlamydiales bacterium]
MKPYFPNSLKIPECKTKTLDYSVTNEIPNLPLEVIKSCFGYSDFFQLFKYRQVSHTIKVISEELIAKELADMTNFLLKKGRQLEQQEKLNPMQWSYNLELLAKIKGDLRNQKVLLSDRILTSYPLLLLVIHESFDKQGLPTIPEDLFALHISKLSQHFAILQYRKKTQLQIYRAEIIEKFQKACPRNNAEHLSLRDIKEYTNGANRRSMKASIATLNTILYGIAIVATFILLELTQEGDKRLKGLIGVWSPTILMSLCMTSIIFYDFQKKLVKDFSENRQFRSLADSHVVHLV